jgi:hypothetical protein
MSDSDSDTIYMDPKDLDIYDPQDNWEIYPSNDDHQLPYDPENNWFISYKYRSLFYSFPKLTYRRPFSYSKRRYSVEYLMLLDF